MGILGDAPKISCSFLGQPWLMFLSCEIKDRDQAQRETSWSSPFNVIQSILSQTKKLALKNGCFIYVKGTSRYLKFGIGCALKTKNADEEKELYDLCMHTVHATSK